MDFALTSEQQRIRDRARQFAREEVAPLAREADATGSLPRQLIARLAELGFLAGPLDAAYGGAGMDSLSFALVCEELGWADSSLRGFLTVHAGLVTMCIRAWGTDEQRARWLPRLASGQSIGCYCLTEPEAGSDAASIQTIATADGGDYVLNGEKIWITNGTIADLAIVFATRDPAARHRGICAFLIPTETPGFQRERMPGEALGHRAS
ncbi:MAG TPA: acyl-CoA dehydrogenase family protein, partial [Ktedonobacterales bacterium]|nr:acyl-CoA dehydrogenase family protein [Ktedonobacterales bacterium]